MSLQGLKYEFNAEISERVIRLIAQYGISQAKLCKEINVPTTTVSGNINNKAFWQIDTLIGIAKYFNVSLDYLVTGKEQNEELHKKIKSLEESSERLRNNLLTQLELNKEYVLKQTDK